MRRRNWLPQLGVVILLGCSNATDVVESSQSALATSALLAAQPLGFWSFDDCSATSTELADSSGRGATASRSSTAACTAGVDGQAITFDQKKDVVTVPNQPAFAFSNRVAVAAWIRPTDLSGTRPIINQGTASNASFLLQIRNGNLELVIERETGNKVTSRAPIAADAWVHVAAIYDGEFAFLFIDGRQVGQVAGAGLVKKVNAPLRIGSNANQQPFRGAIERVWISSDPTTIEDISALGCVRRPATIAITPSVTGPVPPNTTIGYDVALTNNNVGTACGGNVYSFSFDTIPSGFTANVTPRFVTDVRPGQTVTFAAAATGTDSAGPGTHELDFRILGTEDTITDKLTYELTGGAGCAVRTERELMIRHVSVVDDPLRTAGNGAWTFARLMEDMAPTPDAAPVMAEQLFRTWLTDQTVNGFVARARPTIANLVLDAWPRVNGQLDLKQAPLRLLAIVNRIDVRNLDRGHAGEGRFVFGVLDPDGLTTEFTMILEYHLPAANETEVLGWADAWHALGSIPFPSEAYNAALETVTSRFTRRNAAPGRPNGSALAQLRTNEAALHSTWELREFKLSGDDGFLHPAIVDLTPDLSFDGSQALADFVNANEGAILLERHTVPLELGGVPFAAAAVHNDHRAWTAGGIANNDARHHFSLNTCNGCHSLGETATDFLHISPRNTGVQSTLSQFLTGETVRDPVSGAPRTFNDLERRNVDLRTLVCGPTSTSAAPLTVRRGIGRVH